VTNDGDQRDGDQRHEAQPRRSGRSGRGRRERSSGARRLGPLWAVVLAVCGLLAGAGWSLASPPGSAPDDNWHLASIWCAPGASDHDCRRIPEAPDARLIPSEVAAATCFVQDPTKSGECQDAMDGKLVLDAPVTTGNWLHNYPPLFYIGMHPFITDHLDSSVVLMRMANVVLSVLVVGALVLLVPRRLRAVATVPLLVTAVPLSISLLASTNPSAWTVLSAGTMWVALYAAFETTGRRQRALWVFALLMTVIGAGSRADSALFCVMSVGLVLLLRLPLLLRQKGSVLVGALCVAAAAAFFLTSGQSAAVSDGFGVVSTEPVSVWGLTVANAQQLPVLWFGSLSFGFMGSIGWLDTVFPPIVTFATLGCWTGVVFAALRVQSRLKVLALAALALAITAYPLYTLARSRLPVGQGFQPRYALPILIILTGASLLPVAGRRLRFSRTQAYLAAGALAVGHFVALYTQIRRYVTGTDRSGFDLDRGREWWWGGPVGATEVWLVASAAFAVLCVGLFRLLVAPPEDVVEPAAPEQHAGTVGAEEPRARPARTPQALAHQPSS
jgi:Predicted membrane protein (DUF2142)